MANGRSQTEPSTLSTGFRSAAPPETAGVYLGYARRGRNAWWRYLLAGGLGVLVFVGAIVLVLVAFTLAGIPTQVLIDSLSPGEPVRFFLAVGVQFGVILLGFWAAARLLQKKRFGDVVGRWSTPGFAQGALIWSSFLALAALVTFAFNPQAFSRAADARTPALALAALAGLAVQTFSEEWIFRGWITQGLLLATSRALVASVLAGLIFGAVHIPNGPHQAVAAVMFGIASSYIAIRQGGIAFTFGMHLANNLFGAVVVVLAHDVFEGIPGLFSLNAPLSWLDLAMEGGMLLAIVWLACRRPAAHP